MPPTSATRSGVIIKCNTDDERAALLSKNGWLIDGDAIRGHTLEISKFEYEMSADETFAFFLERIRTGEELRSTRRSYATETKPVPAAPQVTVTQVAQPEGRRESNSPRAAPPASAPAVVNTQAAQQRGQAPAFEESRAPRGQPAYANQQGGAKGKGKGKGGSWGKGKGGRPPSPRRDPSLHRDDPNWCFACERLGKPHQHDWKNCRTHQSTERSRSPGADARKAQELSEKMEKHRAEMEEMKKLMEAVKEAQSAPK